jgi:hypothetical protein
MIKKINRLSSIIRNYTGFSFLLHLFNIVLKEVTSVIRQKKKGCQNSKERKLALFLYVMILYLKKNP